MNAIFPFGFLLILPLAAVGAAEPAKETAADIATRALLDVLEERQMADMTLAVLARVEADPEASADLKREAAFRSAAALVTLSRAEADSGRRSKLLDDAQASLDTFLSAGAPNARQALAAYSQKGNLLLERGRAKAQQATRPGVDAQALQNEAGKFFDDAIACFQSGAKSGEAITKATNAQDAVRLLLQEIDGKIAVLKPKTPDEGDAEDGKTKSARQPKLTGKQRQELEALETERESLAGKLIQSQLTAAGAMFEKSRAFPVKSKERDDALGQSAKMFKEIADLNRNKGGGLLARYYEGRNYALLGKWPEAAAAVQPLTGLEQRQPLAIMLRSKAGNTFLECLLAEKKYDQFDASLRKFALEDVGRLPGGKLDADWLGFKYRAAKIFDAEADALDLKDPKNKTEQARLQADARKLATEVAKANADFAKEARELAAKFGKVVAEGERTFAALLDESRDSLSLMQGHVAEAKAAAAAKDAAKESAARQAATAARAETVGKLEEALKLAGIAAPRAADPAGDDKLAGGATLDDVNQGRYLLTYLLYEGGQLTEAAQLGRMLAERYPNAKGSRQAAKIAMAAFQQVSQQADGEARQQARDQAAELAGIVMKTWPEEPESADAALILLASAVSARDPKSIVSVIEQVPATSPRRAEVLLRAGVPLWREVQEARRQEEADRPAEGVIAEWRAAAVKALDDGLAGLGDVKTLPPEPLGTLALSAALSRVQIAMEDGDDARASALLEHPAYGPWTLATGADAAALPASLTEATLTLALRLFVQMGDFDKAETARTELVKAAGQGEQAAAKLTGMFMAMARDLQGQLEALVAGDNATKPEVRQRAEKILAGFEKFLDGIAARDRKTSSQMWVATTYLTLGSGKGLGAVVPPAKASAYMKKSADVYQKLLEKKDDPELAKFEPSIRLKMAEIYKVLGNWEEAQKQLDGILADPKRQNSLEVQIMAAEALQAAGRAAAEAGDGQKAGQLLSEAVNGRKVSPVVVWGWVTLANRVGRQGIEGADERAQKNRDVFFNARLQAVDCFLALARLPGEDKNRVKRLEAAETTIIMTRKLYPDLGGEAMAKRYERLLKDVQSERGKQPDGFRALDAPATQAAAAGAAP